jgi:hypothetical protein
LGEIYAGGDGDEQHDQCDRVEAALGLDVRGVAPLGCLLGGVGVRLFERKDGWMNG